ncbi:MAG TPA: hypothetical protein VJ464_23740 [Blastocatellia bacterium]|nr:hypothetical protein [Blastocatellia bacterium]
MDNIPIKALIVDPDERAARALVDALRKIKVVLSVGLYNDTSKAYKAIKSLDVNVIYIDPLGLGLDRASNFIFRIRKEFPSVAFVLYLNLTLLKKQEKHFYAGERGRFHHYFTLQKSRPGPAFDRRVFDTVTACQGDLSFRLTQEKIAELQKELVGIQESASDDTATVPLRMLQEIQDQLSALKNERQSPSGHHSAAPFLGPPASAISANQCFIIMPYSQEWSIGVETILREVCKDAGFEFLIAKEMEGRFVPYDIWKGITGSALMIADLTGANANVAYEVGLADALGREVILICQDSNVPFDFLAQRLIVYKNAVQGAFELRQKLSDKIKNSRLTRNDS